MVKCFPLAGVPSILASAPLPAQECYRLVAVVPVRFVPETLKASV